jgi:hypothetical protein
MPNLSQIVSQLQAQRKRVQTELGRLDAAINALRGSTTSHVSGKIRVIPRRTMSVAARRKIAAAQKARWTAWRAKQKKAA